MIRKNANHANHMIRKFANHMRIYDSHDSQKIKLCDSQKFSNMRIIWFANLRIIWRITYFPKSLKTYMFPPGSFNFTKYKKKLWEGMFKMSSTKQIPQYHVVIRSKLSTFPPLFRFKCIVLPPIHLKSLYTYLYPPPLFIFLARNPSHLTQPHPTQPMITNNL